MESIFKNCDRFSMKMVKTSKQRVVVKFEFKTSDTSIFNVYKDKCLYIDKNEENIFCFPHLNLLAYFPCDCVFMHPTLLGYVPCDCVLFISKRNCQCMGLFQPLPQIICDQQGGGFYKLRNLHYRTLILDKAYYLDIQYHIASILLGIPYRIVHRWLVLDQYKSFHDSVFRHHMTCYNCSTQTNQTNHHLLE